MGTVDKWCPGGRTDGKLSFDWDQAEPGHVYGMTSEIYNSDTSTLLRLQMKAIRIHSAKPPEGGFLTKDLPLRGANRADHFATPAGPLRTCDTSPATRRQMRLLFMLMVLLAHFAVADARAAVKVNEVPSRYKMWQSEKPASAEKKESKKKPPAEKKPLWKRATSVFLVPIEALPDRWIALN
jgi:hypothetical protein